MIGRPVLVASGALAAALFSTPARADPCTAPLPQRPSVQFTGAVRYVGDGDSLCVGSSTDPRDWIEVRLADFDAPELQGHDGLRAKEALSRIALHRPAICTTQRGRSGRVVVFDRVIARCEIGGVSIGDLLRRAGIQEGGR